MATSLYDLSVASYLQTLGAVSGFLEKGLKHLEANGTDPDGIVETRLYGDMLPFRFQIVSVCHHSLGAIEGAKTGLFAPPSDMAPHGYKALQQKVADTTAALKALTPDEVNALSGKDMAFQLGSMKMPFTVDNFVMSFSLPNFYFHATTAYDILRMQGAPLGKRDFMGPMRMKAA
jgi:hypothetical protein